MKTKTVKKVGKVKKTFPMKKAPMQTPPMAGPPQSSPPMMKKGGTMKKKGKC